jgi:uncharacterized membrane protein YvlD (DUF360 family)
MSVVRSRGLRPSIPELLGRVVLVTIVGGVGLWFADLVLRSFSIDGLAELALAALVLGVANAVIWPLLAFFVVPVSAVTFGIGNLVLSGAFVVLVLDLLPGIDVDGVGTGILIVLILGLVTAAASSLLAVDDDAWYDRRMTRRVRRRGIATTDVPGFLFVQLDGLSIDVLRRAIRSGDVPTLARWIDDGSHHLTRWHTEWSSQTGVSQCGLLHGNVDGMPAFRWVERATGKVMVSNHPRDAAEIERRHSDGHGLLAIDGASYGNLFSGDAQRGALTMSIAGRTKEGRIGGAYARYFSHPYHTARTFNAIVAEVARERRAAADQRRRDVRPRVARNYTYALLRSFTTVIVRDVCVQAIMSDLSEGKASIYVDFLGYDEVSHHSGPERADTLAVLRDLDHQLARLDRARRWAPRPYHIVVLSDHGQTQGATFEERAGESLAELVARCTGEATTTIDDHDEGATESTQFFRASRGAVDEEHAAATTPSVLGSGSLGLVYLGAPERRTLEQIEERYPALVDTLVQHPEIGFVLVATADRGSVVLGAGGTRWLATGEIEGVDPLAAFADDPDDPDDVALVVRMVATVDAYEHCADLMVNSRYDPETEEVAAFEHQVGSHGGLGGPQNRPFVIWPATLSAPGDLHGPVAVHRQLKTWMAECGQPVVRPWLESNGDESARDTGHAALGPEVAASAGPRRDAVEHDAQQHGQGHRRDGVADLG